MGNTRISQVSFARGEFCPPLFMRTDLEQYSIGLKTLKNGFVHQEGCVSNRFGLEYIGKVKDSSKAARLIPFTFNSEQTYIIEAGEQYFRFIHDGGYIVYPDDYGKVYSDNTIINSVGEGYIEYLLSDETSKFYTDSNGLGLDADVYDTSNLSNKIGTVKEYIAPDETLLTGTFEQNTTDTVATDKYLKWNAYWSQIYGYARYDTIVHNLTTANLATNHNIYAYDVVSDSDCERIYTSGAIALNSFCYTELDCSFDRSTNVWTVKLEGLKGKVSSISDNNFELSTLSGGFVTIVDEEDVPFRGEIVEIATPYKAEDLQKLKLAQSGDILTLTHMDYPPMELARLDHHLWELKKIAFEPAIDPPENVSVVWTGSTSSNTRDYTYLVTAVDAETQEESGRSETVTATGHRESSWATSEYFTISWAAVDGALEYNVYRSVNGIFGYVGTSTTTSFVDDKIEPDMTETAPLLKNPFADGNNPSCCAYYQQRKVYADTYKYPQTLYASQTATSNNFDYSRPLIATDAVEITLADREANEIMHLIPFKDLIALTSNSEYKINGADGKFEANPPPVATIQSSYGSSHVQPVVSGSMVLFVEAGGSVIRELGYDYLSDSYDGDELTIFASHLFEGKEIIYMAYAKAPYRLVFVVLNDGSMCTLAYNKKQKICGWSRHETQGLFRSVAVIREGKEDVAYFIIERNINGEKVQYIERTKTRVIKNAKTGFLVDCGLYSHFDTATDSVSGLEHLKNTDVIVLADGEVIRGLKVSSEGTLTLPNPVIDLVVGLPYEFELETLGVEGENTHGLKKMISAVTINILNSREDFFVVGSDGYELNTYRSVKSIDDGGYLYSGKIDVVPTNTPTDRASIHIKQKNPLPITITALSGIVNIEDVSDGR